MIRTAVAMNHTMHVHAHAHGFVVSAGCREKQV